MQSVLGASAEDYQRLGLRMGVVAPWEDGLRTSPDEESFEWWYLDAALCDGSKLTIEFHTKPPYLSPSEPLTPFISLTLDRADGTNVSRTLLAPREDFESSRPNAATGAQVANSLHYTYRDRDASYAVSFERETTSSRSTLAGRVPTTGSSVT